MEQPPVSNSLFEVLLQRFPEAKKNTVRQWLAQERVVVDGCIAKDGRASIDQWQKIEVMPKAIFLRDEVRLLHEDLDLVVVNKPEGLLSVATDFDIESTLHSILKKRRPGKRVFPVHRLDRDVSGVIVYAYSDLARKSLKEQFFQHSIDREYIALVEGVLSSDKGSWQSNLTENDAYFVKSSKIGKLAITHYQVLERRKNSTLIKINLETGRKNQIRVHCSEAGHPICGDAKYRSQTNPFGRVCLHAHHLCFYHPQRNKKIAFTAPLKQRW